MVSGETAHKTLVENLNTQGLKIGHINCNGLLKKIDEVKLLIRESDFDILAITESHLFNEITDDDIRIENYDIIRKDRKNGLTPWGGVAIYHKDHMNVSEYTMNESDIEAIWLNIIIKGQSFLLGSVYRPPKDKNFLKTFQKCLNKIIHRKNIFILGDINYDLSLTSNNTDGKIQEYKSLIVANNLKNVIKDYTRITAETQTLIDHALVTDVTKVIKSGVYDPCISDHSLIYLILSFKQHRQPPTYKTTRNYKNVDLNKLRDDMANVPWWITTIFDDIDDTNWAWNNLYQNVINDHIKPRKVKVRSQSDPWMNSELRKMMNRRYKLLKRAQKTAKGSPEWKSYKSARNECKQELRKAKNQYWQDKFKNSNSTKEFWSLVKSFQGKRSKAKIGPIKDGHGILTNNDVEKANILNKYFATIGKKNDNITTTRSQPGC